MIKSGSLRIFRKTEESIETDLTVLGPGDSFGEMALFEEFPERSASIRSLKPCTVGIIEKKGFINILREKPEIGTMIYKNIATVLTRRLVKANRDMLKLTTAFCLALEGE